MLNHMVSLVGTVALVPQMWLGDGLSLCDLIIFQGLYNVWKLLHAFIMK